MNEPRFSVIVPTYARPDRLRRCLDALAALDYQRDRYEVVVADDGSPTPAEACVAAFADRVDLTIIRQANAGPASARNAAARAAKYQFLAFTDDDCTPSRDWLSAYATELTEHPHALHGGPTVNVLEHNVYARASQTLVDFLYQYYGASQGNAPFFTSNNMAASRDTFLALGGFDESFPLAAAEDREFGLRWRERVGGLRFVPGAAVGHAHPLTLRRFCHQHANYGRGARCLARVARRRHGVRHKIEPARFYGGLVLSPLTKGRRLAALPESALMFLSQVAMTWGFADEWRKETFNSGQRTTI